MELIEERGNIKISLKVLDLEASVLFSSSASKYSSLLSICVCYCLMPF